MAAEAPTYNKMAVKVDGQSVQPAAAAATTTKDDLEQRGLQRPVGDPMPKKRSTFKIMSITKNSPRSGSNDPLNDGDLDSLDELDESHTEEISSDILDSSKNTDGDQDTPSEDTTHNLTPDEIVTKEKSDIHSRFKVVKIETKEPFRRGRWMCYDFLDTPANFERGNEVLKFIDEVPSGNSSAASSVHFVYGVDDPSKNPVLPGNFPPMEGIHNIVVSSVHSSVHSQGTSDSFKPIQSQPPTQPSQSQSQGLYQTVPATRTDITVQGTVLPTVQSPGTQLTSGKHQSQISLPTPTVTTGLQQTQSSSQGIQSSQMNVSKTPSIVNQVSQLTPGVSNTQSQAVPVSKSVSHNQIPNTVQVSSQQPVLSLRDTSLAQPTKSLSSPVSRANVAQSSTGTPLVHVSAGDSLTQVVSVNNNTLTVQSAQQLHMSGGLPVVPQTSVGQINQTGSGGGGLSGQVPLTVGPERPMTTVHGHSQIENKLPEKLISQIGLENKNEHASLRPENIKLTEISESERLDTSIQAATLSLTPLTAAVSEMGASTRDDKEDSGSSTVAIDNKIEQAMDLVKSHLMFAVREEVEVLKEQIKELIEKNNQLEHENNVLKAAASQETLTKLSQQQSKPPASSS